MIANQMQPNRTVAGESPMTISFFIHFMAAAIPTPLLGIPVHRDRPFRYRDRSFRLNVTGHSGLS
jgi:hypothetical protein